jgi:hypothetical protein
LKAKLEIRLSHDGFKRIVSGAFNLDYIGSTCTTSPGVLADCKACTATLRSIAVAASTKNRSFIATGQLSAPER